MLKFAKEPLAGSSIVHAGAVWTQALYDLSAYSGQRVRIGFLLSTGYGTAAAGWYIDDVSIEEGALVLNNPETFESGIGDLAVENGLWEVGVPGTGPATAHTGSGCAGTVLDGAYPLGTSARLILPATDLPSTPQDGQVWLRFWQWFSFANFSNHYGRVEVSVAGGAWEPLARNDC